MLMIMKVSLSMKVPVRGAKTLVTSRHQRWPHKSIRVDVFTKGESREKERRLVEVNNNNQ